MEEAIKILIQVAYLAQQKGILTLDEAVLVKHSIDTINKEIQPKQPEKL